MKILVSHPTGNANVKALINGFVKYSLMHSFHTSIAVFPKSSLDLVSNVGILKELKRRKFDASLREYTKMHPYKEIGRLLFGKMGFNFLTAHESGYFSTDAVYHYLDKQVSHFIKQQKHLDAIYAYEDGALASFRTAKKQGVKCIYDLPIAYWVTGRRLMQEEAERLPKWANTLAGGIKDSKSKLERKSEELQLADTVVVASQFVKNSLPASIGSKQIIVSPFGSPISASTAKVLDTTNAVKPLRVLFVGSMGQRKGLADLFEACRLLNTTQIELVVMGSLLEPLAFYQSIYPNFSYEAGRPHAEVLELMQSCDVFCLPSIVEGRALVMQEAMSQGLPLIITPNTGGEDLIIEGQTGFLVPIRSPDQIAEKLAWCLLHRNEIAEMGQLAQQHGLKYTWEAYANGIIECLI